jgi:hypothetical protein
VVVVAVAEDQEQTHVVLTCVCAAGSRVAGCGGLSHNEVAIALSNLTSRPRHSDSDDKSPPHLLTIEMRALWGGFPGCRNLGSGEVRDHLCGELVELDASL